MCHLEAEILKVGAVMLRVQAVRLRVQAEAARVGWFKLLRVDVQEAQFCSDLAVALVEHFCKLRANMLSTLYF